MIRSTHSITAIVVASAASLCAAGTQRAAIINPDSHRILKAGYANNDAGCKEAPYYNAIQSGECGDCNILEESCWTEGGDQTDFIGSVLASAGYDVTYFEADTMPPITGGDFDIVFVQDPLRENLRVFDKSQMDLAMPDLLEHVLSPQFLDRISDYYASGGELVLVGDAVRLLEHGEGRLGAGKYVEARTVSNAITSGPDCRIPEQWLFVRGNPFCGHDRTGTGAYTVVSGSLMGLGAVLSEVTLENLNDVPPVYSWSDTIYAPADATSLVTVRIAGEGEYVLIGSTCSPPIYNVEVNEVVPNLMGYTYWQDRKVYFIGSDSFFDFRFTNHVGAWHAGQYARIDNEVTAAGREAIIALAERATCSSPADLDGDGTIGGGDLGLLLNAWGSCAP